MVLQRNYSTVYYKEITVLIIFPKREFITLFSFQINCTHHTDLRSKITTKMLHRQIVLESSAIVSENEERIHVKNYCRNSMHGDSVQLKSIPYSISS